MSDGLAIPTRSAVLRGATRSVVYFAQNLTTSAVKIGWTIDLQRRVASLKCGAGAHLRVLRTIDGGRAKEAWLHKRFAAQRVCGEWFEFHPGMLSIIPPDEIVRPRREVVRRDVRLTVLERLRDAEKMGREIGLSDRLILTSFVSSLNDDESRTLFDVVKSRSPEAA
ncbi:GIY-YIG nuclease family protein [Pelagibius sp.]|uniref:GIY-YIG nuclease family protein n=1 Tax=Pelagibius sp. TaxID=1931238 RepID=UPI003BAE4EE8